MATCVWNQYLNYLGIDNSIFRETLFEQIAAGSSDLFKSQWMPRHLHYLVELLYMLLIKMLIKIL